MEDNFNEDNFNENNFNENNTFSGNDGFNQNDNLTQKDTVDSMYSESDGAVSESTVSETVASEPVYSDKASNADNAAPTDYSASSSETSEASNVQSIDSAKSAKAKKEKKPKTFMRKAVRNTACALLLGAVAGGALYGTAYAGYTYFPMKEKVVVNNVVEQSTTSPVSYTNSTATSSLTYVNDYSDIVASVRPSVVAINGTETYTQGSSFWFGSPYSSQTYEVPVSGSGIIIGTNDTELLIVTNAHVVENVNNLSVNFVDGTDANASVKGIKTDSDLAVVAVDLSSMSDETKDAIKIATIGNSEDVLVGQPVIAVGNAAGNGISATFGYISATNRSLTVEDVTYDDLIQTDAAINPGNSGGALFNSDGEVIGINSVKFSDTSVEGMGFAISISSVSDIIDDLKIERTQYSTEDRGYLGIRGASVTEETAKIYGMPTGVFIREVTEDSAAAAAGLKTNDILRKFDGNKIESWEDLVDSMSYYTVGQTVEIVYSRMENGEYVDHTVTVTLGEKPSAQ